MFWDFTGFVALLLMFAPLIIQLILFPIAKKVFREVPMHWIYTICLAINTFLLFILKEWLTSGNSSESKPMDAFDDIIIIATWSPWYIGVLISCIVRMVKARKSAETDKNNE